MREKRGKNRVSATATRGSPLRTPWIRLRRWLFFGLVAGTTLAGAALLLQASARGGVTVLEGFVLLLFAATFGWISLAFWTAIVGFVLLLLRRDGLTLGRAGARGAGDDAPIASRTALVMPVCDEDPSRVMRGLAATVRSLVRTGEARHFDVYLLSDTTDPDAVRREEAAWARLGRELGGPTGLYYRRRERNGGRKAGNIADFCGRWGAHYDFMVVLDADSVMGGPTLLRLVRAMQAEPRAGLIQTMPVLAGQHTLFGRILQFARCLYGPMIAHGLAFWQGDAANYWGHNAIVRLAPFTEHCGLPVLPGSPPLGGEILSHDFVEGALLRRAGWKTYLLPAAEGSWEEAPGNVLDYARRDRRWSQGNLQHLRLLGTPGLHPMSRLHFLLGAMGYLSSSLWLLMLLVGIADALLLRAAPAAAGPAAALATRGGPLREAGIVPVLLAVVLVVLFLPKLLAVVLALFRRREAFGGAGRLLVSAALETGFAVLVAPLMMVYHGRFVASVLGGRDVEWKTGRRGGPAVRWGEAWRKTRWITLVGFAGAALALFHGPALFLWSSPVFAGLVFATPLVRWSSRTSVGRRARRRGLFLVPTETAPPLPLLEPSWGYDAHLGRDATAAPWPLPPERPRAMVAQVLRPGRRRLPGGRAIVGKSP